MANNKMGSDGREGTKQIADQRWKEISGAYTTPCTLTGNAPVVCSVVSTATLYHYSTAFVLTASVKVLIQVSLWEENVAVALLDF